MKHFLLIPFPFLRFSIPTTTSPPTQTQSSHFPWALVLNLPLDKEMKQKRECIRRIALYTGASLVGWKIIWMYYFGGYLETPWVKKEKNGPKGKARLKSDKSETWILGFLLVPYLKQKFDLRLVHSSWDWQQNCSRSSTVLVTSANV